MVAFESQEAIVRPLRMPGMADRMDEQRNQNFKSNPNVVMLEFDISSFELGLEFGI